MVLGAYLLVSSNRVKSISPAYQALNLVGAVILIGYSLALAAWASVVLNSVWALIAAWALALNYRRIRFRTPEPE
jgi:hypothetical protein